MFGSGKSDSLLGFTVVSRKSPAPPSSMSHQTPWCWWQRLGSPLGGTSGSTLRPLPSFTSNPARHSPRRGGEPGTAPRGRGVHAAPGSGPTCCSPAQRSKWGGWPGLPPELSEERRVLFAIPSPPSPALCAFCHPPAERKRPPRAELPPWKCWGWRGASRSPQSITDLKTHCLGVGCSPSLSPAAWKRSLPGGFHVGSRGLYGTRLCRLIRREEIKYFGGCNVDSQGLPLPLPAPRCKPSRSVCFHRL